MFVVTIIIVSLHQQSKSAMLKEYKMKRQYFEQLEYMRNNHRGDKPLPVSFTSGLERRILNDLHKMGLIEKSKSPDDNRCRAFYYDFTW